MPELRAGALPDGVAGLVPELRAAAADGEALELRGEAAEERLLADDRVAVLERFVVVAEARATELILRV